MCVKFLSSLRPLHHSSNASTKAARFIWSPGPANRREARGNEALWLAEKRGNIWRPTKIRQRGGVVGQRKERKGPGGDGEGEDDEKEEKEKGKMMRRRRRRRGR